LLETISSAGTLRFSVRLSGVSSPPPPIFHPFASFSCFTRIPPLLCSFASPPSTGSLTHSHSLFSSTTQRRLVTWITLSHSHCMPRPALPPSAFAPLHGLSNGPTRMPSSRPALFRRPDLCGPTRTPLHAPMPALHQTTIPRLHAQQPCTIAHQIPSSQAGPLRSTPDLDGLDPGPAPDSTGLPRLRLSAWSSAPTPASRPCHCRPLLIVTRRITSLQAAGPSSLL
jgi:hypothetical protein